MAAICWLLVALCVNSFIAARRRQAAVSKSPALAASESKPPIAACGRSQFEGARPVVAFFFFFHRNERATGHERGNKERKR